MSTPIPGPVAHSDAWYALRYFDASREIPVVIGASEAAGACGLSDWDTPLHVYLRKRRLIEDKEATERMENGRLFEPVILEIYKRQTKFQVAQPQQMFHLAENPGIVATPDGYVTAGDDHFIVEAKCSTIRNAEKWGQEGSDEVPEEYIVQTHQQMLVTETDRCDVAVLIDGVVKRYTVRRNERLMSYLVEGLGELLERIVAGDPPEASWRHRKTNEVLKQVFGISDRRVILSERTALFFQQRQSLTEQIKELETQKEECENLVLFAMGDAGIGELPDGDELVRSEIAVDAAVIERKAYTYKTLRKRKPPKKGTR